MRCNRLHSKFRELGLATYQAALEAQDWTATLATLQEKRAEWQLNDWLYYRLIDATVTQFAPKTQ